MEFNKENMPRHIAIIMDGNRRWARAQGKPASFGHKAGAKTLEKIVRYANKIGLEYITVYAFSTENWKRTEEEVKALMMLLQSYLDDYSKRADSENIKVNILGDITAVKRIAEQAQNNQIKIDDINEKMISDNLYTADQPDPDLVIRTSGEIRLSNFLSWQVAYSELLFIEKNWPDFTEQDLDDAIMEYQKRTRKFGAS